jgi:Cu(I)/Ag(I) efflux system membrane fusion protein
MRRFFTLLMVLAIGAAIGFGTARYWQRPANDTHGAAGGSGKSLEVSYWVAPMDPNYRSDKPGKSPMGMDLIPVYVSAGESVTMQTVSIDPAVVQNLGVVTAVADSRALNQSVRTVGRVEYNEERLAHVHLRASGWIHRLAVRAEGDPVERGQLLFEVYSPDLVKAQAEYLQTLKAGREELAGPTWDRLRALGITARQIESVQREGKVDQYVQVHAPRGGVVTKLNVADGKYVRPDSEIMVIADLDELWLISDVFESHADRIRVGQPVRANTAFGGSGVLDTRVEYIYPELDPVTRTIRVRAAIDNKQTRLKPGMYMTVTIEAPARAAAVVIPSQALIRTGLAERVILALGHGHFRPARVTSGIEAEGMVEILHGLALGERVVVSGQFMIDSESSYAGAALRLSPEAAAQAAGTHGQDANPLTAQGAEPGAPAP